MGLAAAVEALASRKIEGLAMGLAAAVVVAAAEALVGR